MPRLAPCVIFLALAALPVSAIAGDRARVTLTYRRDPAATTCPDEATFRGLVSARLGYDPFVPDGAFALTVELQPRGGEVIGRLKLTGEGNERRGERTMRSGRSDCFELSTSMALAAAVAVDPEAVRTQGQTPPTAPTEPSTPPPPPPPPSPPPPPPPPPPAPPPARPLAARENPSALGLRLDVGGVMPVGIVPAVTGGVRIGTALDGGLWTIGAEGAFLFPSSQSSAFGEVSAYVAHGSLVPCLRPRLAGGVFLDLCAVGSLGAMFSDATEVTRSQPSTDLFATVGPRAGLTVMPWPAFGFSASADVPITLSRVHLVIDDKGREEPVWTSSRVGVVAGLSLVLRFR